METLAELQRLFPGSNVYRKWISQEAFDNGPRFALLILLGAQVVFNPRGREGYVSLIKDDKEHIIVKSDYEYSLKLASDLITKDLMKRNFNIPSIQQIAALLSCNPTLILESLDFLKQHAQKQAALESGDRIRVILTLPNSGACGHYRTAVLHNYLNSKYKDSFYCDAAVSISYHAFSYYDCIAYNRVPGEFAYGVFQNLRLEKKIFVYECDDDFANIPDWNIAGDHLPDNTVTIFKDSIKNADVVYTTTDHLREKMVEYGECKNNQDKIFVCPNLIDTKRFGERLLCDRDLQNQYVGFKPSKQGNEIKYTNSIGKKLEDRHTKGILRNYSPVRVLWFGSQTHDEDTKVLVEPILKLVDKYGMAVKFMFFGYCPLAFMEGFVGKGNIEQTLQVKNKYAHAIEFIGGTSFDRYIQVIRALDPDIGLCPIKDHIFNESKSNLKVLELGALGIPCVASNFGEYKKLIKTDVNGILCNNNSSLEWFKAIEKLILNTQHRLKLSEAIYQEVKNQWSWETDSPNRQKWDAMIDRVLKLTIHRREELKIMTDEILEQNDLNKETENELAA